MTGATPPPPRQTKPHILVFPYPAQGHLLPLLDLTHQLCLNGDITISIIITPKNLPYLSPLLSAHPSTVSAITFPFPHHPSLPPGVENVKDIGGSANPLIMTSLRNLQEPIKNWLSSHDNPPKAIISDFFLGWTIDLGLPRFAFFSSGAFLASILNFLPNNLHVFDDLSEDVCIYDIPHSPVFKTEHLPSLVPQSPTLQDLECVKDSSMSFSSYGCVFNSCECLEKEYIEYAKQIAGHNRVFSVGSLSSIGLSKGNYESKALMSWLDGCQEGSVLYICFGSQKVLTKDQCTALALGLEKSMVRFVWVAKKDLIPNGFEDQVAGRGMVVRGWAPQVDVLSHVAVGGFLSHCGWNSALEAMASGTMILAWPMEADQFVDARLLVEHMGVAVSVCDGGETVPDPDMLCRVINETMGELGCEVRDRAKEMGSNVRAATEEGGSSTRDLKRLVQELISL
ncbi:unnamed protein product [Cochlearia groenlandica]